MRNDYLIAIKIFNHDGEIIFTSYQKAADYLQCSANNVRQAYMNGCKCKGYWVDMASKLTTLQELNNPYNYARYSVTYYDKYKFRATSYLICRNRFNDSPLGDFCMALSKWMNGMDLNVRYLDFDDKLLDDFINSHSNKTKEFMNVANLFKKIRNDFEEQLNMI